MDLYLSLPGATPLKTVQTPFVADGSLQDADLEVRGQLADNASRALMKLLLYSRLCTPDLAYAISALAVQVSSWSKNSDKQLHRLVSYVYSTPNLGLLGVVKDPLKDCRIDLFCNADLSGCMHTSKLTSGIWVQISGPNGTRFPISWSPRRQQAISRSTTEAE